MGLTFLAVVALSACQGSSRKSQPPPDMTGQESLNVKGLAGDGDTLKLADLDGCLKILFFNQMDCQFCRELNPKLMDLMKSYSTDSTQPVVTYAYTAGSDTTGWQHYLKELGAQPPFYTALRMNQEKTYINFYHVKRTPTVYLIDDKGTIISPPMQSYDSIAVRTAKYLEAKKGC